MAELTVDDLERRLFQVETLYEIGRECARLRAVPDVLQVILSSLMGAFGATRGLACTGDPDGRVEAVQARGLAGAELLTAEALAQGCLLARGSDAWAASAGFEVCLPFAIDHTGHGAVALGPRLTGQPYSADDRALLAQIVANATAHLQNVKLLQALQVAADDLSRKVHALAAVNEIVLSIAGRPNARRLHRSLIDRVADALRADRAVLSLFDGQNWTVAAWYTRDAAQLEAAAAEALARFAVPGEPRRGANELVAPIRYGEEVLGSLWVRRARRDAAFSADERALLEFLANQAALILENSRLFEGYLTQQQEQFRLRGMLEQYLAPAVAERLITGETRPALEGTRLPLSVLMVDMRGSTRLINHVEPEVMVQMLNQYLGQMTDILFRFEGTVDKFAGDAMLGFFGAPEGHPDDALRAVLAGAAMQRAFADLLADWTPHYTLPPGIGIGVGIATGEAVVGNIGSAKRLEHTIIGRTVNLAARLSARAPAGTVWLDDPTWLAVLPMLGPRVRRRRPRYIRAKGFADLVPVYCLRAADLPATNACPAAPTA